MRSAEERLAFLAAAAFLAIAERSALDKELARAIPPNLPRATAFGFFFVPMPSIISLNGKQVNKRSELFAAFLPPLSEFGAAPLETDVAAEPDAR